MKESDNKKYALNFLYFYENEIIKTYSHLNFYRTKKLPPNYKNNRVVTIYSYANTSK